jgi:hypothetical protein
MSRRLRRIGIVALAAAGLTAIMPLAASADSLRAVIAKSDAPPDARPVANLDREITSYSVLDTESVLAIAYYLQGDSPGLEEPLFVDRYDRKARQWRSAAFSREQRAAGGSDCLGSAVGLESSGDSFLLSTHISPSAECTLVLSTDLAVRAALYGWPEASLADGSIVYQRSQIHFAPFHAAEIAVYSRKTGRSYTIYPSKPYQAERQAEITKLTAFFDAHQDWCNQHNHPCDPELFDNALDGPVAANPQTDSLAFVIDYGSDADDPGAPPVTAGHRKVVYVYRYASNEFGFQYRELPQSDVTARFGNVPLAQLLTPAKLQELFQGGQPALGRK